MVLYGQVSGNIIKLENEIIRGVDKFAGVGTVEIGD